jgi:hypothetical protein
MAKRRRAAARVDLIVWDDAVAGTEWKGAADVEKLHRCTSIGLVVVEDRRSVVLAGSWGLNDAGEMETNNRITIPKGFIVSRAAVTLPAGDKEDARSCV